MKLPTSLSIFTRLALVSALVGAVLLAQPVRAQAPLPLDQQDANNAAKAMDEGKPEESANYGRAVAYYQLERYDDARAALYINLTKYSKSESVLDSQYLMALTLGTIANVESIKEKPDPKLVAYYKNAEEMLMGIVNTGTDVALANDSRFQIGELRFAHASATKDEAARKELFKSAMDVYRVVGGKDLVILAQKAR